IMLAGHFFLKPLMILLDTPLEIIDEALSYIGLVAMFCGVIFLYNLFSGLLRAIGNSFMPLVFLVISSLANIFLDLLFISKFNMGVMGTALATVISQGASGILCLIYILKKTKILIPNRSSFKVGKSLYLDLIGQGLSMALMSSLVNSGTVVLQSSINKFGKLIIAGHISARKVFSFTNIPIFTLSLASATFVSQNLGAGKIDRVKKGVWTLFGLTTVWSIICMIVVPLISRFLISSISGSTNPEIVDYGSKYLNFMQPFYIVLGVLLVTRNSLQGLGSKILPLISSIIELLGKILFTAIIIPRLGTWGIILCEPLIWVAMTIELLIVYFRNPIFKNRSLIK
ncbi:MAG: polysaccharide biosynthesis C-terminal domain-containing protein, partial [Treponema sp.]|nr:polysaccharide biosynthesis C-terminal domain-containing protein [Treponema sp.]